MIRTRARYSAFKRLVETWRAVRRAVESFGLRSARPFGLVLLLLVSVGALGASAVIGYRLWQIPGWVVAGSKSAADPIVLISAYRAAQASILGVLVQALGGLAIVAGLFFTWRQLRAGQEAQVSERYSRCVEQLGNERVEVRVAGIEGLERIADDRRTEFVPILRMLSAFVVERSNASQDSRKPRYELAHLPLDIQLAIAVLQRFRGQLRRTEYRESVSIPGSNFAATVLAGIDFDFFDLSNSKFDGADLKGAWFISSNISGCSFVGADMQGAYLIEPTVWGANFSEANLRGAYLRAWVMAGQNSFRGASLVDADCEWSHFEGSDFRRADLTGARLYGAKVGRGSHLENVDLSVTRGLYDLYAQGGYVDAATEMPGKDAAAAAKEKTDKAMGWRPAKHPDGSISY